MAINAVTVFCGSRAGDDPKWADIAAQCGRRMAQQQLALVFGGGCNGLMGAIARAVIEHNGKATGIIPESLLSFEPAMDGLTELFIVDSMHTRKLFMSERADAFLVLPGGIGTFEEFFETWTWRQIGLHQKPIVLLNAFEYYTPLLRFLDQGMQHGFIRSDHRCHVRVATQVDEAFELLTQPCD
ncbi:MAG: hypothetical protein RL676_1254 [Pseudomonadota bacterium]|jgi:uncharacterized protein (TIGR00730 family)